MLKIRIVHSSRIPTLTDSDWSRSTKVVLPEKRKKAYFTYFYWKKVLPNDCLLFILSLANSSIYAFEHLWGPKGVLGSVLVCRYFAPTTRFSSAALGGTLLNGNTTTTQKGLVVLKQQLMAFLCVLRLRLLLYANLLYAIFRVPPTYAWTKGRPSRRPCLPIHSRHWWLC